MSGNLLITEVKSGSKAEAAGVMVGDAIWIYDEKYIGNDKALLEAVKGAESKRSVVLEVLRGANGDLVKLEIGTGPMGIVFSHPVKETDAAKKIDIFTIENIRDVSAYLGTARGSTVRGKNAISDLGAGLKNIVGGELKAYTQLMADAREQAIYRMQVDAQRMGANAVIGVRFTSSTIDVGAAEICAYGTAVIITEPTEVYSDD